MIEEDNEEGLDFYKNFKYGEEYSSLNDKLFILQVPQSLLEELKQKNEIPIISKNKGDTAKLVSNTDTYKVKRFDYPNSYFLNQKKDDQFLVLSTTKSVYQLEKLANQKDNLYKFLSSHQVKESAFEGDLRNQKLAKFGFEINDLMNDYFMSRRNIIEYCQEISAIQMNDKIYFLETEIFLKIFRELSNVLSNTAIEQNSQLIYENITLQMMVEIFPSINQEILLSVLQQFCKQTPPTEDNKDSIKYTLTYESLCRFIMTELFLAKKEYYMDDFIEFVEKMVAVYIPESIQNSLNDQEKLLVKQKLRNKFFLIYDTNNYQQTQGIDLKNITLVAYNHYHYTFEPKERVAVIFEKKKNYFPNEFRDFLDVLNLQKKELDDLVLNSCRSISISIHKKNQELFSSIYPQETLNKDKLNAENFSCKVYNYKKK